MAREILFAGPWSDWWMDSKSRKLSRYAADSEASY